MRVEGRDFIDLGERHLHLERERGEMGGRQMAVAVLAHRLVLDVKARHGGASGEAVVADALRAEPVPP